MVKRKKKKGAGPEWFMSYDFHMGGSASPTPHILPHEGNSPALSLPPSQTNSLCLLAPWPFRSAQMLCRASSLLPQHPAALQRAPEAGLSLGKTWGPRAQGRQTRPGEGAWGRWGFVPRGPASVVVLMLGRTRSTEASHSTGPLAITVAHVQCR